jgi:tetratricopeptide (TPR) repeat protein
MKLVPFARARRRPDPARLREFAGMARKLQQERETAAEVVATLLRETPPAEWPSLPELRTVGAVEELAREVEARLDREPREALAIAELATTVVDALNAEEYPAVVLTQTRALAWKDVAQALRYLARNDEALVAADRAALMLTSHGTLAHDLAIVQFVRAMVLQEIDRYDESLQLLNECRRVFLGHGDARRVLLCGIAEGMLLHRLKRFGEARQCYVGLLEIAHELHPDSLAIIHINNGYACIELSDFAAAEHHLSQAITMFRELEQPLHVAMAELARGRVMVRRGAIDLGIAHLRRVRAEFMVHGLVEEAGIAGLDIVEAFLGAGRAAEAELLAREIIHEFTAARLNTRAISALGYLHEALEARTASTATVVYVRDYIDSLRTRPEREFVACA